MNRLLLLFVPFLLGQSVYSQDKVTVRGNFSGAPGHERLYLEPTLEMYPPFREENIIEVTDGQFQFEILAGDTLLYSLLVYSDYLKGLRNQAWFFPDSEVVTVDIFADPDAPGRYRHTVRGGSYNQGMSRFTRARVEQLESLHGEFEAGRQGLLAEGRYYRGDAQIIYEKLTAAKTPQEEAAYREELEEIEREGEALSDEAIAFDRDYLKKFEHWTYHYLRETPLAYGMVVLCRDLQSPSYLDDLDLMEQVLNILEERYPRHPYIRMCAKVMETRRLMEILGLF